MHIHFKKIRSMGKNALYVRFDTVSPPLDLLSLARAICAEDSGVGTPLLVCLFPSEKANVALRAFLCDTEVPVPDVAVRAAGKLLYDAHELSDFNATVEADGKVHRIRVEPRDRYHTNVTMAMGAVVPVTETTDVNAPTPMFYIECETNGYRYDYTPMMLGEEYAVSFVEDVDDPLLTAAIPYFKGTSDGRHRIFCAHRSRDSFFVRIIRTDTGEDNTCGCGIAAAMAIGVILGIADFNTRITVKLPDEDVICVVRKDLSVILNASVKILFEGDFEYDNEYDDAFEPTAPTTNSHPIFRREFDFE